jgi:hypothetical protein
MKRPNNNIERLRHVQKFRDDAVKDGWSIKPTYFPHESVDSASSLSKDGFSMLILTRTHDLIKYPNVKNLYEVEISIWGPDGLAIEVPDYYDMELIKKNMYKCKHCGKFVVETVQYSFAGRCCKDCLPALKEKFEKPGWCD